jgi:hypothetical protein
MEYNPQKDWFSSEGIPITPTDDTFKANTYSLMKIIARDAMNGETLGQLDVVLPVATETDCQNCHKTGEIAADNPNIVWANDVDKEVESKKNILILHDTEEGTHLAKIPAARTFQVEDKTVAYAKGDLIRCDRCHEMPDE